MQPQEPSRPTTGRAPWALWALGFRPLYLGAALFAAVSVPLWALQFAGWLPGLPVRGPLWHAHEMVFGFALAVVAGFLLTAGRNWSNRPTPSGKVLMALAALWLAARLLAFTPWAVATALANVAFPLAVAWGLGRALWAGQNRRNYFFVALLVLLALATGLAQAALAGWIGPWGLAGLQGALGLVLVIVTVMAGRVIPMFTNNAISHARATRHATLERAAIASVVLVLAADLLSNWTPWVAPGALALLALAAALLHCARWWLWQPWTTLRTPLVWVLHLAYLWVPVHLALRAAAAWGLVGSSPAQHALTVGAIGGLTIGMMTRTARGHTGRPLRADGHDIAAYGLVLGAALLRVALPLIWPPMLMTAAVLSAALWSAGFAIYAWHYRPWLCRARVDGQPG